MTRARIDHGTWSLGATAAWRPEQRPEAGGLRGMVASAHPVAALVGMTVLAQGGNAFDAAVAVAAAEGVLLPMMCGLGGDAFVVLYDARRHEMVALNGSGPAAAGATREYYTSRGYRRMPLDGVHSVGVPGAVGVYEALWKRYGTRPWSELWAPAIRLAEEGLAITAHVSYRFAERAELLARDPYSARQFLPEGRPPAPGERWAAPDLGKSLRAVAQGGADAFYRGELAERILAFLRQEGALFVAEDLAHQEALVYTPIATDYRGVTVYETAPVSQGFLLLEQLNILEGFDLQALPAFDADRIHLTVEAKKLAFADRNGYAGDPASVRWPLEHLISKAHAARRRAEMDPGRAAAPGPGRLTEQGADTSYFAAADGEGNAVSFIHSLSASFGSGVVAGDTGITLNNRVGRGFTLDEGHPNVLAPGKRTMHTLNAYLVCRDGRPWLIGGTPGGDQQTQWNVQTLTNILDHGMSLQDAVEAPRWYSFPGTDPATLEQPMVLRVEDRISEATRRELRDRGHVVGALGPWSAGGAVQLIELDYQRGVLRGASDPRAGGVALGF
ncbi:MAG: gamma-glutamyltransferase [Candidatus Rokubacteria bacterium]|nr:gamma-glutamyltransferase [Candidatus Rokubacteria bacterium]